ncbi:hypothetical protein L596_011012 [Steinernema carpocapsae]|uniref:Pre-mRNA-splicing factor ISY1 homolog n=1 Tax=Steinernema carpocapsae TaxID=34508 RepID=A0A4U5NSY0_STECR|nr:hypothetical protein L596_011012 [Steinernema carpocapsae]
MARNAEKAMTALARWRRMKEQEEKGPVARRPHDVLECRDLKNAERFRREVTMDIAKKIALIQNPGLGEYKIRDLNDEINKQLRVKHAWEKRIKDLGGTDYMRGAPRELDKDGSEVAGSRGYKYFGAAKDLPGVRELFEQAPETKERIPRSELTKNLDADYYGYMCDDDGILVPLEQAEEVRSLARLEEEWADKGPIMNRDKTLEDDIYTVTHDSDDEEEDLKKSVVTGKDGKEAVIKHVAVPTQEEVEAALVERKKQFLLDQFVGSN